MQQNETQARCSAGLACAGRQRRVAGPAAVPLRAPAAPIALVTLVTLLASVTGCAHDVRVRYPDETGGDRGVVSVLLDDAADVTLAVNGLLLVSDAHTKRIEISNLPVGYAELAVSAGGSAQQTKIWVTSEHATALPMGAPTPPSPGIVASLLSTAVSVAVYVLTRQLFL